MIVIIDYGLGNLRSIQNMLGVAGSPALISSDIVEIEKAEKLILPGVGAFDKAIGNIEALGLRPVLERAALIEKKPILGICLGMQLLTRCSEEGKLEGLGFIDGETVRFSLNADGGSLKIPHMGWNTVQLRKPSRLFENMPWPARFYFVHSYHVILRHEDGGVGTTVHGREFVSVIEKDNICGVQFHPEKSHKYGLRLLQNFAEYESAIAGGQDVKDAGYALPASE
jgi:glutamine amidotransferase